MEKNHYIHYTAADLLNDGTFLDSMQHPTEQSEKFWSQLEKENEKTKDGPKLFNGCGGKPSKTDDRR